jgi:hypothetical protein
MGITGVGLDSSKVRLIDSHLPVLTVETLVKDQE